MGPIGMKVSDEEIRNVDEFQEKYFDSEINQTASESILEIEEISVNDIENYWKEHIKYLIEDEIITDDEDIEYFSGNEYRDIIKKHMLRDKDKHHLVYFLKDNIKIGAASYCNYKSEDGKCFILDFWVFPRFRGKGRGHECFSLLEKYLRKDGAKYFEINAEKVDSIRFWKSIGFIENGKDEYDMQLFIKK